MLWEVQLDIFSKHLTSKLARWLNQFFFGELVLTPLENPENSQGHLWSSCHLRIRSERSLVASEIPQGEFLHRKRALLWFLFAQLQSMGGDMWPNLWLSSTFQHHPWYVEMLNLWSVIKFPLICAGAKVFNLWVCWPFWIYLGMNTISKLFRSFFFFIEMVGMSVHWNLTGNMKFL